MSDLENNLKEPGSVNERPSAYCQHCGKPLTPETARPVGQSVYCEPCLEAKLAGEPAASAGYTRVNAGPAPTSGPAYGTDAYYRSQATATGFGSNALPNPGLAFLLGLIPGVGAMYNEQYAKGLVHLVIFAVLVMFAHVSGIFGLFIAGWVFYMAIEAHHTARAKRDGTPLPNPFGLNDIGDRMGFGPNWINGQGVASAVQDAANAASAGFRPAPGAGVPPITPPPQPGSTSGATGEATAGWGAPVDAYPGARPYAQDWNQQTYQQHYGFTQTYPPYGSAPPYAAPVTTGAVPPPFIPPIAKNRFPVGAVWLIGLGTLFLLGTEGIFSGLRGGAVVGLIIIALGVTVFVRRMTAFGGTVEDDGSHDYQFRLLYALRGSAWLLLAGALFLLDTFRILYWDRSWPLFIILAGVMMLLRRVSVPPPMYPAYPYVATAPPVATPAATGTDITRLNLKPDATQPENESDAQTGGR